MSITFPGDWLFAEFQAFAWIVNFFVSPIVIQSGCSRTVFQVLSRLLNTQRIDEAAIPKAWYFLFASHNQ